MINRLMKIIAIKCSNRNPTPHLTCLKCDGRDRYDKTSVQKHDWALLQAG